MLTTIQKYRIDIRERLAYGPALVKQACHRLFHRVLNGPAPTAENVVVSLTSFPQRLPKLHNCIKTLLDQSLRPEKVILYLARDECNMEALPKRLSRMQSDRFEIRFVDRNTRSLNKICHTLVDFPDKVVVTSDDDKLYPLDWLKSLITNAKTHPNCIVCNRSRRIVFDENGQPLPYTQWPPYQQSEPAIDILPMGVGGVVYPPGCLHPDVLDVDLFMELCPTSDDLWLKIMSLRKGTHSVQVVPVSDPYTSIPFWAGKKLYHENMLQGGNDKNLANLLEHFNLDLAKLIRNNQL